jgi:hypothetical protein
MLWSKSFEVKLVTSKPLLGSKIHRHHFGDRFLVIFGERHPVTHKPLFIRRIHYS